MAATVIRANAKATGLAGMAGVRTKACGTVQRAMACVATAVMVCAVGAALLQLAAQMLSFPAPIAVTGIAVMAVALLHSLRRHLRTRAGHPCGPRTARRPAVSPPGSDR